MALIKVCDICKNPADTSDAFVVGRSMDAAGSMADDVLRFDLCWKHRSMAFSRALEDNYPHHGLSEYKKAEMVIAAIKRIQGQHRNRGY